MIEAMSMKKAVFFGMASSFFFAFTFLLNRSMNLGGGYWMWTACLRYLLTLPMLGLLLLSGGRERITAVWKRINEKPGTWVLWSTVGFGLFYVALSFASAYGESWLVAASWQMVIVTGTLLTPLFGKKIPFKNVIMACVIVCGVLLLQMPNEPGQKLKGGLLVLLPILLAAIVYPLGNRKMMVYCPPELDATQRVFGMTLCSIPFWLVTALIAFLRSGLPGGGQVLQSCGVALFSGTIATTLFFHATSLVKENPRHLAVVEATQAGEVIFVLLGSILLLGDDLPSLLGFVGLALVVIGMVVNSLISAK